MDLELMLISLPKLLYAAITTIELLVFSLFIGLMIGTALAILRLSKNKLLFYE